MDRPKDVRRLLNEKHAERSFCKQREERLLLSARLTAQQRWRNGQEPSMPGWTSTELERTDSDATTQRRTLPRGAFLATRLDHHDRTL